MQPTGRSDRRIEILVVACALALSLTACGGSTVTLASLTTSGSSVPSTVAATAATTGTASLAPTASPSRTAGPTPIPTLPATTTDATTAPPGAISIKMAWQAPRYEPDQVTAKAGTVVFFLRMAPGGSLENHNLALGPKIHEVLASSGFVQPTKSAVFTVIGLQAGSYTFWCQVPGHAASGMVGTLTVTP